jgi:hypothetical protein
MFTTGPYLSSLLSLIFANYFLIIHFSIRWAVKKFMEFPCRWRVRDKTVHTLFGEELSMSPHRCNRSGQVSACSVVTVPFELGVSVGHLAQCRSSNSVQTSSSCANWENLLLRRYRPCSKFTVILHWFSQFKNG